MRESVRIFTNDEKEHRAVEDALDSVGAKYYTLNPREPPRLRTLLKGLPFQYNLIILNTLKAAGLAVIEVRLTPTKNNFPLYAVDFIKSETDFEDLRANHRVFGGIRGVWVPAIERKIVPMMCNHCCGYGHREARCRRDPCCTACGRAHVFYECPVLLEQETPEYKERLADPSIPFVNKFFCVNCHAISTEKFPIDFRHPATLSTCHVRVAKGQALNAGIAEKTAKADEALERAKQQALTLSPSWPELRGQLSRNNLASAIELAKSRKAAPTLRGPHQDATPSTSTANQTPPRTRNRSRDRRRSKSRAPSRSRSRGVENSHANVSAGANTHSGSTGPLFSTAELFELLANSIDELERCRNKFDQLRVVARLLSKCLDNN